MTKKIFNKQLDQNFEIKFGDFKQQYENNLLGRFRKQHPMISDKLAQCLVDEKPFTIEIVV